MQKEVFLKTFISTKNDKNQYRMQHAPPAFSTRAVQPGSGR
jgi:hypothetical protein